MSISSDGNSITRYHSVERLVPLILGLTFLAVLVGLQRRSLWGWKVGSAAFFLLIAQLIYQGLVPVFTSQDEVTRVWAPVSQLLCAGVVFYVFWKWWVPLKKHFNNHDASDGK